MKPIKSKIMIPLKEFIIITSELLVISRGGMKQLKAVRLREKIKLKIEQSLSLWSVFHLHLNDETSVQAWCLVINDEQNHKNSCVAQWPWCWSKHHLLSYTFIIWKNICFVNLPWKGICYLFYILTLPLCFAPSSSIMNPGKVPTFSPSITLWGNLRCLQLYPYLLVIHSPISFLQSGCVPITPPLKLSLSSALHPLLDLKSLSKTWRL